jgi:hypothetical protein
MKDNVEAYTRTGVRRLSKPRRPVRGGEKLLQKACITAEWRVRPRADRLRKRFDGVCQRRKIQSRGAQQNPAE